MAKSYIIRLSFGGPSLPQGSRNDLDSAIIEANRIFQHNYAKCPINKHKVEVRIYKYIGRYKLKPLYSVTSKGITSLEEMPSSTSL